MPFVSRLDNVTLVTFKSAKYAMTILILILSLNLQGVKLACTRSTTVFMYLCSYWYLLMRQLIVPSTGSKLFHKPSLLWSPAVWIPLKMCAVFYCMFFIQFSCFSLIGLYQGDEEGQAPLHFWLMLTYKEFLKTSLHSIFFFICHSHELSK